LRTLKRILSLIIGLWVPIIILFNLRLYYQPSYIEIGSSSINSDVVHQLNFLKEKMHIGAADDMQKLFPEGFVFLNSLYALSWIELAQHTNENQDLFKEAIDEINWVLMELESPKAKRPFYGSKGLPYGIFYNGWYNYVLARKCQLMSHLHIDSTHWIKLQENCKNIIEALNKSESPFLESYPEKCWPADMTVAMASVAIGNRLLNGPYQKNIDQWIIKVESKTDSIGLIPHSSYPVNGNVKDPSRGSSQSLILNFLQEIDSSYARNKFNIYKKNFVDYRLGMPGIREYPKGKNGNGDIDSGPVLFGIGGAASIVGQRVMTLYAEDDIALGLRNCIESFAIGITIDEKKRYLFGLLPMADAFIAWSNSSEISERNLTTGNWKWNYKAHLVSIALLLLCGIYFYRFRKL